MDNIDNKFAHGKDTEAAIEYLKEIGVYEKVANNQFGFCIPAMIIIAANVEYKKRNG